MAPPGNDAKEAVDSILEQDGGKAISVESVDLAKDFGPDHATAHVVGKRGDGTVFEQRLTLSKIEGRWHVALGESRSPGKNPASTSLPGG